MPKILGTPPEKENGVSHTLPPGNNRILFLGDKVYYEKEIRMQEEIQALMADLDEAYAKKDVLQKRKEDLMNSVLTDEIKDQLKAIEEEFAPDFGQVEEYIKEVEGTIKDMTLQHGEKVSGDYFVAVFNKGRKSWDSKKLEGMALVYPAIEQCRKVGNPYITLKRK